MRLKEVKGQGQGRSMNNLRVGDLDNERDGLREGLREFLDMAERAVLFPHRDLDSVPSSSSSLPVPDSLAMVILFPLRLR